MVLIRRFIMLVLMLLPMVAAAQVEEALEQWVEETDNEQAAGEMHDQWLQLQASPPNINDTHALGRLFFLSPFQRQALGNYIALYGQLLSLKELLFVPGFDSATVVFMTPLVRVEPYVPRRRWRFDEGRHRIVTAVGGTVEQAAGYRDSSYEGDNFRALLCYNYSLYDRLDVRFVVDKDPGEPWGQSNFVGYHLMLNHVGPLERLVVGRYNLQFGQGLTLWTGLRPFNILGASPVRFGQGVRQAATFYEEDYQQGLAACLNLGRGVRLSVFGSRVEDETLAGGHLEYRHGNLIVGATVAHTALDSAPRLRDYLYNYYYFRGNRQLNAGVDVVYQWQRLLLYGEASMGENGAPAAIGGFTLQPDSRNRISLTARYFHPEYHNLHSQPFAIGSGQGEQGVTLDAESRLPLEVTLLASVDLHSFPVLRYADYSPSTGEWLRLQLSRQWGGWLTSTLRYSYRRKARNIPNIDSTLYLGENTLRQQWQGELRAETGPWRFTARAVYALFDSENNEGQRGGLVSVAARYAQRRLQASAALAWFDVDGYYARIYFSETNLQYAWSMPALYGRGLRAHAVLRYAFSQHFTLAAKYALTYMPGQESIGSGDAETEGPFRQTWMLQMRLGF